MPRTAREIYPNVPHHIVQRGNRRQPVFFNDSDYMLYLSLLRDKLPLYNTKLLAYCLMHNHVHLIVEPDEEASLQAVAEVNKAYSRLINKREGWISHLWQGRFASYPMDEQYLYHALRYVELNPVFAGLAKQPEDYAWSSARQRIGYHDKRDLKVDKTLDCKVSDWHAYWHEGIKRAEINNMIMQNEISQKPMTMGTLQFVVSPRDSSSG